MAKETTTRTDSVSEATSTPYQWLQQIPSSLLAWERSPLKGAAPQFPWEKFSEQFAESTRLEDFTIEPGEFKWRGADSIFSGIAAPHALSFAIPALDSFVAISFSQGDLDTLISILATGSATPPLPLENEIRQGFHQFLALEAVHAIRKCSFDPGLSIELLEEAPPIEGQAFCVDLTIALKTTNIRGRLIIPSKCQENWVSHYSSRTRPYHKRTLATALDVTLNVEVGKVIVEQAEWESAALGDFIVLDSCTVDPTDLKKGRALITAFQRPFFRAKFGDGKIKLLELPQFQEVDTIMNNNHSDAEEEDFDEDSLDDEFEFDENDLFEEEEDSKEAVKELEEPEEEAEPADPPLQASQGAKEMVSSGDIPLTISIEVARLNISLGKLMELEPGNLIELNATPEDGVDLVVNGKRVARGELLKIGETLGVRILEKG